MPGARCRCRVPGAECCPSRPQQSPYPVILSLENHCGLEQQVTMARHMRAILGDALLTQPLEGQDPQHLPSPEVRPPARRRCVPASPASPERGPSSRSS